MEGFNSPGFNSPEMQTAGTAGSSAASNSEQVGSLQSEPAKRKSDDVGWDYGELTVPNNYDKIKCKLCDKAFSGGIYRLKQHIAGLRGNVKACPKSTPLDKSRCLQALEGSKKRRHDKKEHIEEVRGDVTISKDSDDVVELDSGGSKPIRQLGPMDQFARAIDPDASMKKTRQQNINDAISKNRTNEVHTYLAKWVYGAGIPFNAINNDDFHRFCEAVGQFGPGYIPPSQHQLREPLLKKEVERIKESLKEQEDEWKKSGCSIMTDAWSDRKRRSIMNLCVNCRIGTSFLNSIECSNEAHTAKFIFDYVDKYIQEVGPKNVIQVVTDNASNNMVAAKILREKRPHIFWTSCATHTLNLMLEAIGKTPKFKVVIDKAKALTIFIYAHHKTLALMRKYTNKRDIVRPGVTRFASAFLTSAFLTMESILEKKEKLKFMFLSEEWGHCKFSSSAKGVASYATIVNPSFWTSLLMCFELFKPLVKVLRLVDGDWRPSMGFVYGELKDAKKEIIKLCKERNCNEISEPIIQIIDSRAKDRLDSPLHLAGYLLNPYYYYRDDEAQKDPACMTAILTCIEAFFPDDFHVQHLVSNIELLKYKGMEGMFGKKMAKIGRMANNDTLDVVGWWSNYGAETPNLQMMAMKILSLTSSSSGCERNWSTFEGIHTKKRNRLDAVRMSHLVYVQFNSKLLNKKKKMKEKYDILVANDASMAQGWIVDGGDDDEELSLDSNITSEDIGEVTGRIVRELDEEDFQSEDEVNNNENLMFDFDESDMQGW